MKFSAMFLLLAFVATAYAGKLSAVEQPELKPESEAESKISEPRDKRGLLYSAYATPYAAAFSYPVAYTAPVAYASPLAYSAYRPAYYPSYYNSYVLG